MSRSDFEIKKENIAYHNLEAEVFEKMHPDAASEYERSQILNNITYASRNSKNNGLCVDVGCGTGIVTSLELRFYRRVLALDISRQMLNVVKKRLSHLDALDLVVSDAENLPLRNEIADMMSISSVLHHLPKPFKASTELSRVLKKGGFLYVNRDPNLKRLSRIPDFCNRTILNLLFKLPHRLSSGICEAYKPSAAIEELDYAKVDVHLPTGFHTKQLSTFLQSKSFAVISAYSYLWIYCAPAKGLLQKLMVKSNFALEKIPLFKKFGIYVSLLAKKV